MNRLSLILISSFILLFGAVNAQQTEKSAPVTSPQIVAGQHGGILFTEENNTMEFVKKGNFLIVFPDEQLANSTEMGSAKFTVVDENNSTVIENVEFKNGMYSADGKKAFANPKVKFEATINGKQCIMNFEMPSRH